MFYLDSLFFSFFVILHKMFGDQVLIPHRLLHKEYSFGWSTNGRFELTGRKSVNYLFF